MVVIGVVDGGTLLVVLVVGLIVGGLVVCLLVVYDAVGSTPENNHVS